MTCQSLPSGKLRSPPPDRRNLSLDGLRGTAAFVVVVYHFLSVLLPGALDGDKAAEFAGFEHALWNSPLWVLVNGHFAVVVFFVLSGYVLTADVFATGQPMIVVRRAAGRLLRLGLPAGASTIFAFLLLRAGLYRMQEAQAISGADALFDSHGVFAFPHNLASLLDNLFWRTWFVPPDPAHMYNLVLWTMPIEFWGSMVVLSASFMLAHSRWRGAVLAVAALVLWNAVPVNGPYLAAFVAGTFLAAIRAPRLPAPAWMALAVVGLLLGAYHAAPFFAPIRSLAGDGLASLATIYGVGAFLLVAAVLNHDALGRFFSRPPLVYLGKISFSLYLVHQPIIFSLGAGSFLWLHEALGYATAAALSFVLVLAASFGLAHLVERWIDRPSTSAARRFSAALVQPAEGRPAYQPDRDRRRAQAT